jgi:acylphosphatase
MAREAQAFHAFVSGVVQGVGFRWSAFDKANSLGLSGWVRNTSDGRVELAAEGRPEALEEFTRWLRAGPPGSRVDRVDSEAIPPTGTYRSFRIAH